MYQSCIKKKSYCLIYILFYFDKSTTTSSLNLVKLMIFLRLKFNGQKFVCGSVRIILKCPSIQKTESWHQFINLFFYSFIVLPQWQLAIKKIHCIVSKYIRIILVKHNCGMFLSVITQKSKFDQKFPSFSCENKKKCHCHIFEKTTFISGLSIKGSLISKRFSL